MYILELSESYELLNGWELRNGASWALISKVSPMCYETHPESLQDRDYRIYCSNQENFQCEVGLLVLNISSYNASLGVCPGHTYS